MRNGERTPRKKKKVREEVDQELTGSLDYDSLGLEAGRTMMASHKGDWITHLNIPSSTHLQIVWFGP
jgi:hypothetical protein